MIKMHYCIRDIYTTVTDHQIVQAYKQAACQALPNLQVSSSKAHTICNYMPTGNFKLVLNSHPVRCMQLY